MSCLFLSIDHVEHRHDTTTHTQLSEDEPKQRTNERTIRDRSSLEILSMATINQWKFRIFDSKIKDSFILLLNIFPENLLKIYLCLDRNGYSKMSLEIDVNRIIIESNDRLTIFLIVFQLIFNIRSFESIN